MYREKVNEFINAVSGTQDPYCLEIMEDLINTASDYDRRVKVLEIGLMVGKYDKDGTEYKEYIEKLHKQRSDAHNILISNVKIINRQCKKYNLPLIYKGNEQKTIEVAAFAKKVIEELFSTRKLQ